MPIQISIGNDEVILPNNLSSIPTIGNADTSVPVLPPNITPLSGLSLTALSDENIVVTGSPIVNGGTLTFALAEMNVVPGTYTSPVLTIDAYGRIAAAESFAATPGQGTVIEIAAIGDKNITVIGDSVTASGTFSFALTTTGVTAGTYGKVTVDEYGRVTAGIDLAAADINIALGPYAVANANEAGKLAAAQTIAIAGDAFGETTFDGSAGATIVVTLAATGVTAGTYTNAAFVVDETGRVTNADSDVAGSDGTFSAFISTDENITVAPPFITNNATIAIGLATNGVSVGTYTLPEIVVDAMGRVTSAISLDINSFVISIGDDTQEVVHVYASGNSFGQAQFRGMVGNGNISVGLTTDDSSLTFSLTPTTVTAGTYSNANIVVDAYGRLTSAVNGTSGSGISGSPSNELISVDAIGDSNIFVNGGPITTEGTLTIGLGTTGVIAGSYTNFVVDSYGRLIAARGLVASDVTTALGTYAVSAAASAVSSEQLATAQTIAIAGDIAGSTTLRQLWFRLVS